VKKNQSKVYGNDGITAVDLCPVGSDHGHFCLIRGALIRGFLCEFIKSTKASSIIHLWNIGFHVHFNCNCLLGRI